MSLADASKKLRQSIRDIPDFPKKGIVFKDITTMLQNPETFKLAIDTLYERYRGKNIAAIAAIESRGFIFGSALAYLLGCGFVPIRKKGKLPYKTYSETYDLEYGTDTLEVHIDAFKKGANVLIIDDLLATGGTALATCKLVEKTGAKVAEVAFITELEFLGGRKKMGKYGTFSVIQY